jgi:23S rRNA (cytidine1920-2'-O)/16S rRNA (cytidine1409-2'-O)-methyltransferase
VLDVGSSTGGFTDFALKHGAKKVIAVDVGTNQLHPTLRNNPKIELHEQTDIRNFHKPKEQIDLVLIDVSFISLREILPSIARLVNDKTYVVAMAKPQFEAGDSIKHKGVIKNEKMRRNTLATLENWIKNLFIIIDKADSQVSGSKGNVERFYLLRLAG